MILKVSHNPDAAMDEEQNARFSGQVLGRHYVQLDAHSVLSDRLRNDSYSGHVHRYLGLERGDDLLGLRLGQLPERTAVLVEDREKGPYLRINSKICCRILYLSAGGLGRQDDPSEDECGKPAKTFHLLCPLRLLNVF